MQYKKKLNRIGKEILFDKKPTEPSKPEKPLIIDNPHQPKPGQQVLTDCINN